MKAELFAIAHTFILRVSKKENSWIEKRHMLHCKLSGLLLEGLIRGREFHSWPKGKDFSLIVYYSADRRKMVQERLEKIFKEINIEFEEGIF